MFGFEFKFVLVNLFCFLDLGDWEEYWVKAVICVCMS